MRRPVIEISTGHLRMREEDGYIRRLVDVPTAAQLILETQAWFARHRRGDPDSVHIDDATARATVIDVLSHSLLTGPHARRRREVGDRLPSVYNPPS